VAAVSSGLSATPRKLKMKKKEIEPSGGVFYLFSGSAGFKSRPGHQLFSVKTFCNFTYSILWGTR
jgi:hypothetical protein